MREERRSIVEQFLYNRECKWRSFPVWPLHFLDTRAKSRARFKKTASNSAKRDETRKIARARGRRISTGRLTTRPEIIKCRFSLPDLRSRFGRCREFSISLTLLRIHFTSSLDSSFSVARTVDKPP